MWRKSRFAKVKYIDLSIWPVITFITYTTMTGNCYAAANVYCNLYSIGQWLNKQHANVCVLGVDVLNIAGRYGSVIGVW